MVTHNIENILIVSMTMVLKLRNNSKKTPFHYIPSKFETKVYFGKMTQLQEPKAINVTLAFMLPLSP